MAFGTEAGRWPRGPAYQVGQRNQHERGARPNVEVVELQLIVAWGGRCACGGVRHAQAPRALVWHLELVRVALPFLGATVSSL